MVIGSAKRSGVWTKASNAECRSGDAGKRIPGGEGAAGEGGFFSLLPRPHPSPPGGQFLSFFSLSAAGGGGQKKKFHKEEREREERRERREEVYGGTYL